MKRMICFVVSLSMLLVATSGCAAGFPTADDCMRAIVERLSARDYATLEECFAFDQFASGFNADEYYQRLDVVSWNSYLPPTNAFNISYNAAILRKDWYYRLRNSLLLLQDASVESEMGKTLHPFTSAEAQAVFAVQSSSDECFCSFRLENIIKPVDMMEAARYENYMSDKFQQILERDMLTWQVTEYAELIGVVQWDQASLGWPSSTLWMPLCMIHLEDGWYASPLISSVATFIGSNVGCLIIPAD